MFANVFQNRCSWKFCNIPRKTPVLKLLFSKVIQSWRSAILLKGGSNTGVFLWILQNFSDHLFWRTSAKGCFCTSNHKVSNKCWASFLNQKHDVGCYLLRRFVDLLRLYDLLNISRNHSNKFLLLDLEKNRSNVENRSSDVMILTWFSPLLNVYANDMQLNRWRNFCLKFVQYLFLESVFVSLDKSILLHRSCVMSKFSKIFILLCRKIFSAFHPILHETFPNSYGFSLMQEYYFMIVIESLFVQSWLIWATFCFCFIKSFLW